jgi:hypothetical protein
MLEARELNRVDVLRDEAKCRVIIADYAPHASSPFPAY